jgi:glycosyltransferase involved in cell wall biosynthesis
VYVHGHSVGGTNPALLQALGAGAPTLALDTPFNAEVLPYSEQLFPHNAEVLADRIRAVVGSRALQQEMAQRGRTEIRTRYSWDDVCRAYMDALVGIAEDP